MQTGQDVFERYEKKYRITRMQYNALQGELAEHMQQDQYGQHTICNLYMDTDDYTLIRSSIEKPIYKEKLRLRSYGTPQAEDIVFLELKKKFKGVVYKRRVPMALAEAYAFMRGEKAARHTGQILQEIAWFMALYGHPTPKVCIAYDRVALADRSDANLRITFDDNIRYRNTQLDLSKGSGGTPMLQADQVLMEIKVPGTMPVWLSHLLAEQCILPTSFSKYGVYYEQYRPKKAQSTEEMDYVS